MAKNITVTVTVADMKLHFLRPDKTVYVTSITAPVECKKELTSSTEDKLIYSQQTNERQLTISVKTQDALTFATKTKQKGIKQMARLLKMTKITSADYNADTMRMEDERVTETFSADKKADVKDLEEVGRIILDVEDYNETYYIPLLNLYKIFEQNQPNPIEEV